MRQRDRIDQAEESFANFIIALASGQVALEVTKKLDAGAGEVTTYRVVVDGAAPAEHL